MTTSLLGVGAVLAAFALLGDTVAAAGEPKTDALPPAVWQLTEPAEPLVLAGYTEQERFDLELPTGWVMADDAVFTTTIVASVEAREDAAIRFDLDGRPVHTWTATDAPATTIPIPHELFADGTVVLDIATTTPLRQESTCADPDHVSRWFDLGEPTVRAAIIADDVDVARAIAGIGPISALTGEPVSIIIEGAPTDTALESAGAIVAAISRPGKPAGWHFGADPAQAPSGARIRIIERAGEPARVSVDVIAGRPTLAFEGDPAGVVRLADAVADPGRLLFFVGTAVDQSTIPAAATVEPAEVFSFVDAGYDDRTLRGFGSQALIYRIHIPAGAPPDTATLGLSATMSPAMAAYEATISVKVNGSDEEIVAVAEQDGEVEALHTVTPADLRPGLNFVTLRSQLGVSEIVEGSCGGSTVPNWLTISRSSAVAVDRSGGPQPVQLGIEDARFALASEIDFDATDVAVPDAYTLDDLLAAFELVSELASRSQGGSPRLTRDGDVDRGRHVVVTGEAGDRELLRSLPYLDGPIALVAAQPSPYAIGRVFMAFTGNRPLDVRRAIETAMSSDVNDITAPYALIGLDSVRAVGDDERPAELVAGTTTADDQPRQPGPDDEQYEAWLRGQLDRIEADRAPETNQRRTIALVLGFATATIAALWWLRRTRSNNDVAPAH